MTLPFDPDDNDAVARRIRALAHDNRIAVGQHALQEILEDGFSLRDVVAALQEPRVLENYPEDKRGPSCLIVSSAEDGRAIHVVCTTAGPQVFVITVYEPVPPRWISPTERGTL